MTIEQAIEKAQKLLRLAKSSNAHEAALAAQRAQEILTRYEIDTAALDTAEAASSRETPIEDHGPFAYHGTRLAGWRSKLAHEIAEVNACKSYTMGPSIGIIGRPEDAAKVRALYAVLSAEVDRLTALLARGQGRVFANNFRIGCVHGIGERLEEAKAAVAQQMRAEHAGDSTALVRIDNALARLDERNRAVARWCEEKIRFRTKRSSYRRDNGGYAAGHAAGRNVNVGGARPALAGRS